jgi:4'-phosphopantetheinyl transferase
MPLIEQIPVLPEGRLGLWAIEESEGGLLGRLDLSEWEQQQLGGLKGAKRLEFLSVRLLVHEMSGNGKRTPIGKDTFGKPFLPGFPWSVSLSHSGVFSAALLAPGDIGVDVQRLVDKIGRIAHKFVSKEELPFLDTAYYLEHLHVYWGAKEAIYKAYGKKALDFCHHIRILPFSFEKNGGIFHGQLRKEEVAMDFSLCYRIRGDYMLVWAVRTKLEAL